MKWVGPYTLKEFLDNCLNPIHPQPPNENGVYFISRKSWCQKPTKCCEPLYVGTSPDKPERFKTRMGLLISHMIGLFSPGKKNSMHSGGKSVYEYCKQNKINPMSLYVGWAENVCCPACAENSIFDDLKPRLNKRKPKLCKKHNKSIYAK
jgi:hypothetical protein